MSADISILDVDWSPSEPAPGEAVEFRVQVRNDGTSTADSVGVVVKVNGEYSHVPPNFSLAPDEKRWTVQTGNNTFSAGTHSAEAIVEDHDRMDFSFSVGGELGAVAGRVTAESGEEPHGSRIYLSGDGISTQTGRTDANGEFRFEEIPPGEYTVEFTDTKYEGFESKSVTVQAGETAYVTGEVRTNTYELTIRSDPISPQIRGDDEGEYAYNEDLYVEAPATYDGYEFEEWRSPDGTTVWEDEAFTFTLNSDRTIVAQYSKPGKPDLTVNDISVSPSNPTEEDTVEFDIELQNQGESAARNFDLELSTGDGYITRSTNLDLDANSSGEVRNVGSWNPSVGTHTVEAEVNYNQNISEESYRNNTQQKDVSVTEVEREPEADLAIEDLRVSPSSPTEGDTVEVTGYIENNGGKDISNVRVELSVDGREVDSSSRGIRGNDRKPVTIGQFSVGTGVQTVKAEIDPYDTVDETTTSNNTATTTVSADESIETVQVDLNAEQGGEIEVQPPGTIVSAGSETFEKGTSVTLRPVNVAEGYKFESWSGDVPSWKQNNTEITISIDTDVSITAVFDQQLKKNIGGEINSIDPIGGVYEPADSVRTDVVIGNLGNTRHTFFVGYSIFDESGAEYTNGGTTGKRKTVGAGEFESVTLEWDVESEAPAGSYDVTVSLWEESNRDNLSNEIDSVEKEDVFDVKKPNQDKPNIAFSELTPESDTVSVDETTTINALIANTGGADASDIQVAFTAAGEQFHAETISIESESTTEIGIESDAFSEAGTVTIRSETSKPGSESDESRFSASTTTTVEVTEGSYSVSIRALEVSPNTISDPGDVTVTGELVTKTVDPVTVDVTGEIIAQNGEHTAEIPSDTYTVSGDSPTAIESTISVTPDFENVGYDVAVTATSESAEGTTEAELTDALAVELEESSRIDVRVAAFDEEFGEISGPQFAMRKRDGSVEKRTRITRGGETIQDVPTGLYEYEATSDSRNQSVSGKMYVSDPSVGSGTSEDSRSSSTDKPTSEEFFKVRFPLTREVSGVVVDHNGNPIQGADVKIASHEVGETITTNTLGMFKFTESVPAESIKIEVTKGNSEHLFDSGRDPSDHFTIEIDHESEVLQTVDELFEWRDDPVEFEDIIIGETRSPVIILTKLAEFRELASETPMTVGHGVLHGIITSLVDTIEGLAELGAAIVSFLLNIIDNIKNLINFLKNLNWEVVAQYVSRIIAGIPELVDEFIQKQDEDNPHDLNGDAFEQLKYNQFSFGWYTAYIFVFAITSFFGGTRIASSAGTVLKSSSKLMKAQKYTQKMVQKGDDAAKTGPLGMSVRRRSKSSDITETETLSLAGRMGVDDALRIGQWKDALNGVGSTLQDTVDGGYILSHRTFGVQRVRQKRGYGEDRDVNYDPGDDSDLEGFNYPRVRQQFEKRDGEYTPDPSSIELGSIKGGIGEALSVKKIARDVSGEFKDITEDNIYASYYAKELSDGQSALITNIDLQNVLDRVIKPEYNKGQVKQELEGVNEISGELDLVRVTETKYGTAVERFYDSKAKNSVYLDSSDVTNKISTFEKIKKLDDHPGVDSTKVIEEWGISIGAFTRSMRRDIDTISGSGAPDLKLITASDTTIRKSAPDGILSVNDDVIRLSHSNDQIKKATEYLFTDKHVNPDVVEARRQVNTKSKSEIKKDIVNERKSNLEFIFKPDYTPSGGQ